MSISFGNKNVKEMYFGNRKVAKVYFGNQLVWPKAGPIGPVFDNTCWVVFEGDEDKDIWTVKVLKNYDSATGTGDDVTSSLAEQDIWIYSVDPDTKEIIGDVVRGANLHTNKINLQNYTTAKGTYKLNVAHLKDGGGGLWLPTDAQKAGGTAAECPIYLTIEGVTPTGPVARELNSTLSFLLYDITDSENFVFYADADYSSVYYWASYITNQKPSGSIAWGDTTYTFVTKGQLTGMTVEKMADGKYKYSIPKDTATCLCVSIPSVEGPWSDARLGTIYMIDADESPTYISQNKLLFTITAQLGNWNNAVYNGNNLTQDAGWMTPAENGTPYYKE